MTRVGVLMLGGIALLLCSLIALESIMLGRPVNDLPNSVRLPPLASVSTPVNASATLVSTILARPLFDPSRTAPQAERTAAADGMPRLSGIMISPNAVRSIFTLANGKPVVVSVGSKIGPYVVNIIDPDSVTVSNVDGKRVLRTQFAADGQTGIHGSSNENSPPALGSLNALQSELPEWLQNSGSPDLPNAATWSGVAPLSRLPAASPPAPASAPLLAPASP